MLLSQWLPRVPGFPEVAFIIFSSSVILRRGKRHLCKTVVSALLFTCAMSDCFSFHVPEFSQSLLLSGKEKMSSWVTDAVEECENLREYIVFIKKAFPPPVSPSHHSFHFLPFISLLALHGRLALQTAPWPQSLPSYCLCPSSGIAKLHLTSLSGASPQIHPPRFYRPWAFTSLG